jgi:hypothetical protein
MNSAIVKTFQFSSDFTVAAPTPASLAEASTDPLAAVQVRLLGLSDEHAVARRECLPRALTVESGKDRTTVQY